MDAEEGFGRLVPRGFGNDGIVVGDWVTLRHQPQVKESALLLTVRFGHAYRVVRISHDGSGLMIELDGGTRWVNTVDFTHAGAPNQSPDEIAHAAWLGVRALIRYIGDDPDRPGLADTPQRVLKAWRDAWGAGYRSPPANLIKLFPQETGRAPYDQMIVVRGITFASHCEHHLAPFSGSADLAYIPDNRGLLGISKLARIVDLFACRLQVQERLTQEIADYLAEHVSAVGCGVIMRASHSCMTSRGVKQPNAQTVTSALRGAIKDQPTARQEFLMLMAEK